MRIFTAKGDHGGTDLLGERVTKDDARIALLGDLDEATSAIGLGRALASSARTNELLVDAQRDLYKIMAELAFTDELRPAGYAMAAERVTHMEAEIDALSAEVQLPPQFVLPGESVPGAALDVARTVVRRAERAAVALDRIGRIANSEILRYLNRLSSLLFILARFEDREAGAAVHLAKGDGSRQ